MRQRLIRTYLSEKPSAQSFVVGMLSLGFILLVFTLKKDLLSANGNQVFIEGQYWRAFTTSLVHADLSHLANNSLFYTGLAILLHSYYGAAIFPVLTLIFGGIINLITLSFYPPQITLVGISGVIYFMAAFWLTLYVAIERKYSIPRRLINGVATALIFLFPQTFETRVSYLAHFTGFALGIAVGAAFFIIKKKFFRSFEVWEDVNDDVDWYPEDEQGSAT